MKYFNESMYAELVEAILAAKNSGDEDALEDAEGVVRCFDSFSEYVSHVSGMEDQIKVAKFHMDVDNYQHRVMELDSTRRNFHDTAIVSVRILNRTAKFYGIMDGVFTGSDDDRYQVAEFCVEATHFLADVTNRLGRKAV